MNDLNNDSEENTTTPRPTDRRPLGYWLRVVDEQITREFATVLEGEGITRRDWMLLNVLARDVDAPGLQERLARKGKRLRGLEERGWAEQRGDGTWTLTDLGRSEKERLGVIVDGLRTRLVEAVGDEAFATTMTSLETIARELGWDESTAGRRGFGEAGFGGSGRPRPFRPEMRFGWGPNLHRGFESGDHPFGHGDPHAGRGHADHDCHGHTGREHGHHGHSHHGREHGQHCQHGHSHHDHHGHRGGGGRSAQRAYERGFDAGFSRGRETGAA